jgi:hypothetical protein
LSKEVTCFINATTRAYVRCFHVRRQMYMTKIISNLFIKFDTYVMIIITGRLLVPGDIIRPIVSASVLTWFIGYIVVEITVPKLYKYY